MHAADQHTLARMYTGREYFSKTSPAVIVDPTAKVLPDVLSWKNVGWRCSNHPRHLTEEKINGFGVSGVRRR